MVKENFRIFHNVLPLVFGHSQSIYLHSSSLVMVRCGHHPETLDWLGFCHTSGRWFDGENYFPRFFRAEICDQRKINPCNT